MRWIDRYGDRDRDGFQEYQTRSSHGYYNQGWKDAGDAIPHADGTLAPLPIATVRAPGLRLRREAPDGRHLRDPRPAAGRPPAAARGARAVRAVQRRVLVGGRGDLLPRPRRRQAADPQSVASNAGHLLQSGIVPPERAGRVVERLLRRRHVVGLGRSGRCRRTTPRTTRSATTPGSRLAARQRDDRRRLPALRLRRRGGPGRAGHVRRRRAAQSPTACPSCSPGLPRREASFPVQYLGRERPAGVGRRRRSSGWSRSCAGSTPRRTPAARGSTSTRRCPTGCRELTIRNLRAGRRRRWTSRSSDGEVEVLRNTTGFEIIHGPAPRPEPA